MNPLNNHGSGISLPSLPMDKSQDLKRALREDGKHVTYSTNYSFGFSHLCTTIMFPRL